MASLYIQTNQTKNGKTYAVKYRRGGMGWTIEHAGTFKTMREANIRKTKVGEWLAAGLNPKDELRALTTVPVTMAEACDQWLESRRSVSDSTRGVYRAHIDRIKKDLTVAPSSLRVADVNEWVGELAEVYKPASVGKFVGVLRQVLDHVDVSPNPARDRRVELPRRERREVTPPTADEFLKVLRQVSEKHRLPVVLLEQTGMRVSEAASLRWDDVDADGRRLRVAAANSKTGKARWVEVPDWVIEALGAERRPLDRGEGSSPSPLMSRADMASFGVSPAPLRQLRVFPGATRQSIADALRAGCARAGVPVYGPHQLRHRRASIMHNNGVPAAQAAAFLGHSPEEHLRTYAHVMPVDEVSVQDLLSALD